MDLLRVWGKCGMLEQRVAMLEDQVRSLLRLGSKVMAMDIVLDDVVDAIGEIASTQRLTNETLARVEGRGNRG
jgi:hypothetical protein